MCLSSGCILAGPSIMLGSPHLLLALWLTDIGEAHSGYRPFTK